MLKILRRAIVPTLLLAASIAAIVYGTCYHVIPVVEEREERVMLDVPAPFAPNFDPLAPPPNPDGPLMPGEPPFGPPPAFGAPPATIKQAATKITQVTVEDLEPVLVREVTFAGVIRLPSGEYKRTHSADDEGPALCPT